jgi:hypothetical protein
MEQLPFQVLDTHRMSSPEEASMPSQHRPLRLAVLTAVTGLGTTALTWEEFDLIHD